jgi:hypothetical protein
LPTAVGLAAVVLLAAIAVPPARVGASDTAATSQPTALATSQPDGPAASQPDQADWPPGLLMERLNAIFASKPVGDLGVRTWGFIESGLMGRLTGGQDQLPGRLFDARRPDELRLNQLRLTVDRPYDATKDFDLGGRVDLLFGGDAKLTHAAGLLDKTGEGNGDAWLDIPQAYAQAWFKTGADSGLEVLFGKFVTTHGIEVIDATGNALYSHSYLFDFAIPFTHTGVKANYVFNPQASAYFAVVEGWDVFQDNNHDVSYMAGGALSSKEQIGGHARTQYSVNVITGPEQAHNVSNNRTVVDNTLTYWWTDKLSESVNADYGTEENVPGVGRAQWYGAAHYLTYAVNEYVAPTWRFEGFRDQGGSRTGVDTAWYESTWGVAVTPWPKDPVLKNLSFRPELRWDFAGQPAFGGGRRDQLTLGFDLVFKF